MILKRGIRRITVKAEPVQNAGIALAMLRAALTHAKAAGACYTAARIRLAISSAHGALRNAQYEAARAERRAR